MWAVQAGHLMDGKHRLAFLALLPLCPTVLLEYQKRMSLCPLMGYRTH